MRFAMIVCAAFALMAPAGQAAVFLDGATTPVAEHGGGCRASSPPGQCCHADKKRGGVHCH